MTAMCSCTWKCSSLQRAMDYDASEPDVRAFYPAFAEAVKADLDVPGMEHYESDAAAKDRP